MTVPMSGEFHPRVGIPYRNAQEETEGKREKYDFYVQAVRQAGGEPVEVSLSLPQPQLALVAASLDAVVLTGSPRDVDPAWYHAGRHKESADADPRREQTDFALLDHAFSARKPVLAICYGLQSLNVWLGGRLIQHILDAVENSLQHEWLGRQQGAPEPYHSARIEPGTRLAQLAGAEDVRVNSSHHQAVDTPGRGLRIAARAPDGVIEAVEHTGDAAHWVVGVQWHPERMAGDGLARALFRELLASCATRTTA